MASRLLISVLAITIITITHDWLVACWDKTNIWSCIAVAPHVLLALVFYQISKRYDASVVLESTNTWKDFFKNRRLFAFGALSVVLVSCINMAFLLEEADAVQVLSSYASLPRVINTLLSAILYAFANAFMFVGMLNITKAYIKAFWVVLLFAILQIVISAFTFTGDNIALHLLRFVAYLTMGYSIASHQKSFAFGFYFAYELLPTRLICTCTQIIAGIFAFSGVAEMGYTPAFLYSFQIVAMGLVAAYYGRQAYLVSMNRAELVDRGYMMVRDQHGVETPMLRATYQYNVRQAIKPWIALTEAGKKRRRGRAIMQELEKGWSFYEVFNAQGELQMRGFIDTSVELAHTPYVNLQDNRPKLAFAWELDTDALYYVRVEFEGNAYYGALAMFSYETDHKRFAYDPKNRLYNTWIHPNEEKVLPCKLYKSNGEEFSMQVLYDEYSGS